MEQASHHRQEATNLQKQLAHDQVGMQGQTACYNYVTPWSMLQAQRQQALSLHAQSVYVFSFAPGRLPLTVTTWIVILQHC